jgi:DNA-binding response OmpR family regulator
MQHAYNKHSMKNIRTLIVEDEQHLLQSLGFTLRRHGHGVTLVNGGESARQVLQTAGKLEKPYDLLITDIQLPGITGLELIDECKRSAAAKVILVITAHGSADLRKKLALKGVNNILLKPFSMVELVKQVEKVLENSNC